jgi:glycosyltransferase involved in cell wall biosynthesis
MSVYNGEKYLSDTIDSIIIQSLRDIELLIINDGSTDSTQRILHRYCKRDKRIKIIRNKTNLGFTKSLNKGLRRARGKYIARIDADDICMPDRFQIQHDFLESHPEIFLVGSWAENIDEKGNKLSLFRPPCEPEEIARTMETRNCMFHISIMFRNTREYLYREKMCYTEDNDLYLRCLSDGKKLANIPKYLVKYRRIPTSASFSKRWLQMLFSRKAREFYFQRQETGKDSYNTFDPDALRKIDPDSIYDKEILREDINANFAANNMMQVRKRARQYTRFNGINSKIILYTFATYVPLPILNPVRRTLLSLRGKY